MASYGVKRGHTRLMTVIRFNTIDKMTQSYIFMEQSLLQSDFTSEDARDAQTFKRINKTLV